MSSWWDRFTQRWASGGLTDDPTSAQANVGWAYIGQAPPTVEQFNSTLQWDDDKDNWLFGQIASVITSAGLTPSESDLTLLLRAISAKFKVKLTGPTTFYVSPTGSDSTGTGEAAHPWQTIQKAANWLASNVDFAGFTATIQLAATGSYTGASFTVPVNGNIVLRGDPANIRSYLVKNTNGVAVSAAAAVTLFLEGLSVEGGTVGVTWGVGIEASLAAQILFRKVAFGPCYSNHLQTSNGGFIFTWDGPATTYAIYGGGGSHIYADTCGMVEVVSATVTITGSLAFSSGFLAAHYVGIIEAASVTWTGAGGVTGVRVISDANSVVALYGQNPDTTIPGNALSQRTNQGLII